MGKPHGQGRCAALSLSIAGLRTVQQSILLAGVLLALCPGAFALNPALDVSQYAHTSWKIRDGFTKGSITSIAQTPDGYIWLGTEFGLLRFDGVRAIPWQPAGEQLPANYITSLLAARDGTLWVGMRTGLASWKDGRLTKYPELAGQLVYSLLEDRDGTVWAGGIGVPDVGKLCAIRSGSVQCNGGDGSLGDGIVSLYEDAKGNLWVGGFNGFWRWKGGPSEFFPMQGGPNGIRGFVENAEGRLLIGTHVGIKRLVDGRIETYPLPGPVQRFQVNRTLRDRDGGFWVGTLERGLVHVHKGKADVFSQADGLTGDFVDHLLEDREGNIWVATTDGLDRFRAYCVPTISLKQGLLNSEAYSVLAAQDGDIWIGTRTALYTWKDGQISVFGRRMGSRKAHGKLRGEPPNSFFQDSSGRIWVSTNQEFGYVQDDKFVPIRDVPGGPVHSIAEVPSGHLWIANQNAGLLHLFQGKVVQHIPWGELGRKDYAHVLAADPSQRGLWLGFYHSGVAYFADGGVRVSYSTADGLGEGVVNDLRFATRGALWAATESGLSRILDGRIQTLTSKNGLPCDQVHWSIEDDDHFVWIYTSCGLVRTAQSELDAWAADPARIIKITIFDTSDGITSHSTAGGYSPRVAKSADGKLWFALWDGVSVIDPRHLPVNKVPPPVHVQQITADRKTYWQNLSGDASPSPPRLPPQVRDLTIDYTALSLVIPEKVLFRYKLEGWDHDWQDAGTRRQAFYSNLAPRKYRFRVMACNNSGVWNETGALLDFSIAPAYYQTTWFQLSCVAAFLAVLWGLYQLRLRQLAREFNAGLEARVNERTRIARELHDSLLQGVQGLMFRLQAVRDMLPGRAPAEAIKAFDIALERGDKAIAEGRDTVSDLREPIMGDSDITQALTALGKELALQSGNGLVPRVGVLLEGKQRELNPMLRDEIYRIAREALRNAFRHARAQKIEAEITYSDAEFLLHVRDDGGGLDPAVANQGTRAGHWGLPGMRERAKSFGGKLEVWSEHGAGTEIELSVPGAIAYGKSEPRRRFWEWRKKIGESDGQQS